MANILIVGVGGQGTLLASRVLGEYAIKHGYDCKVSEVHGMAQRGGSVVTYVKFGKEVHSPIIDKNCVDMLISFEYLEGLRYLDYLKEDGIGIINTQKILPLSVQIGDREYPTRDLKNNIKTISADTLAEQAGSIKVVNTVILGRLFKELNVSLDEAKEALLNKLNGKLIDINIKALELGYNS